MMGVQAVREVLRGALRSSDRVQVLGEALELSPATQGLLAEYPDRVHLLPAADATLAGVATGMALAGHRPVVELAGPESLWGALQQLGQEAAANQGTEFQAPVVFRVPVAPGQSDLATLLTGLEGIIVAIPSNPSDLAGMLRAALSSNCPVVLLEHRTIHGQTGANLDTLVAFGHANVVLEGQHATVLACGEGVSAALTAAERLANEDTTVEVVDLRTLAPFDTETVANSVHKTGRPILVGTASVLEPQVIQAQFLRLEAPPISCEATPEAIVNAVHASFEF